MAGSGFRPLSNIPTAASRRVWTVSQFQCDLIILSDQLRIVALVGLYPTNQLIRPGSSDSVRSEDPTFSLRTYAVLAPVSGRYPHYQADS